MEDFLHLHILQLEKEHPRTKENLKNVVVVFCLRVTIAVMKKHNQKQLEEERVYLAYTLKHILLREATAGTLIRKKPEGTS